MGLQRVGHDWATFPFSFILTSLMLLIYKQRITRLMLFFLWRKMCFLFPSTGLFSREWNSPTPNQKHCNNQKPKGQHGLDNREGSRPTFTTYSQHCSSERTVACFNESKAPSGFSVLSPWWKMSDLIRPWRWERLKAGGGGDNRGWDGWMASPTQWTWAWASSGSWWWTGKPGVLQSMGLQEVDTIDWTE